jgi:hypothetical protein
MSREKNWINHVPRRVHGVAYCFETTDLLGKGDSYTSEWFDLVGYYQFMLNYLSDQDGTLVVTYADDAAGVDVLYEETLAYSSGDGFEMVCQPVVARYVRVMFTCDAQGQLDFYMKAVALSHAMSPTMASINAPLEKHMTAVVSRSILTGVDTQGAYHNIGIAPSGGLAVEATEDRFTNLLDDILVEQRLTNRILKHIAGDPLLDKDIKEL